MADNLFNGDLSNILNLLSATGALGTAAAGLVDATKAYGKGGISTAGFKFVEKALAPFQAAFATIANAAPMETLRANWINGVAKSDQKAVAKSLIRLGLTPANVPALATSLGFDAAGQAALATAVANVSHGTPLTQPDINILGRFDTIASALLDAGYERADQKYRNTAKLWAMIFSLILAVFAGWFLDARSADPTLSYLRYFSTSDFLLALVIGVVATPLAPVVKDLASSLQAAVAAVNAARR